MNTTVLNEILAFLFGRKYYANVIATNGIAKIEICSYIFATQEEAKKHQRELDTNLSYSYVTTVSFRSRKNLLS